MKKVLKLVAILLGIGIVAGCTNTPSKQRMNEELKKPEVVEVIEAAIKNETVTPLPKLEKLKHTMLITIKQPIIRWVGLKCLFM